MPYLGDLRAAIDSEVELGFDIPEQQKRGMGHSAQRYLKIVTTQLKSISLKNSGRF